MNKTTNSILKKVLEEIDVPKDELIKINKNLEVFIQHIKTTIKSLNLEAEIFVGGSFARKTLIRKGDYDIDLFIRFDKKHKDISGITEQLIKKSGLKEVSKIHGSRDYFRIKISENLFFEIIPVKKIKTPKEADNITDLSYSHVKYIKKKIKKEETLREIRLAKAFCYASRCYGAESYIKGFSGYSLELLIYHYKSFANFIKSMSRIKEKLIIDIEKYYKNKNTILLDLNASKVKSPIILVDPTYKTRNVLAALSDETFKRFQKYCADFLKNPSEEKFRLEKKDIKKIERQANKNDHEFI
ncbi:MAG: nucleotidyltransferase domain-containing protein, partial [Nanoarchaeota archaeon]|nr:nucleotidyltransferase domain-containing protein [Nanoarchaeota archaeon]